MPHAEIFRAAGRDPGDRVLPSHPSAAPLRRAAAPAALALVASGLALLGLSVRRHRRRRAASALVRDAQ